MPCQSCGGDGHALIAPFGQAAVHRAGAVASLATGRDSAVIDAGGGASPLAQRLTNSGFTDVTVLDVSAAALAADRARPGSSRICRINYFIDREDRGPVLG